MNFKVGDTFSKDREITDELIRRFAEVSGDYNPIHLDEEFAKTTRFGQRIAHGMLGGAFISGVLGYELNVRKIVYMNQKMKFIAPVFIGDTITTTAKIINIREDKPIVTIETVCVNQTGETVIKGEAVLMMLD
jgi:3-hydroxybutyryl-CoA dehydratase